MTTTITFPDLDAAINAESWEWLQDNAPLYDDAVARLFGVQENRARIELILMQ